MDMAVDAGKNQKSKPSLVKRLALWRYSRAQSRSALLIRLRRDSASEKLDSIFRILAVSDPDTASFTWTDDDTELTARIRVAIEERGEVPQEDLYDITELYTRIVIGLPAGREHEFYRVKNRALLGLFKDARRVATFAVREGRLPGNVDVSNLTRLRRDFDAEKDIELEDVKELAAIYQELEAALGPITAESLQATERPVDEMDVSVRRHRVRALSPAGAYLQRVRHRTFWLLALLASLHIADHLIGSVQLMPWMESLGEFLTTLMTPWFYGALGASVFILKKTSQEVRDRVFHVRSIPRNRSRFWLGTIAGGMIVIFAQMTEESVVPVTVLQETLFAALGFLAGYSTHFFYNMLDGMLGAIGVSPQQKSTERVIRIVNVKDEQRQQEQQPTAVPSKFEQVGQPKPVQ